MTITTVAQRPAADPLTKVIGRDDYREALAELRLRLDDPNVGLFGPESMIWRMVKPLPVLPLALSVAGLLEAPHPYVAVGTEGSKSAVEFVPRFHRSVDAFLAWFYGDWRNVVHAARRVYGHHRQVSGELPEDLGRYRAGHHYEATETEAMLWVWATIVWPIREFYERICEPLSAAETEQYYEEAKRFAELFGIDHSLLPPTWSDFTVYFSNYANSDAMDLRDEFLTRPNPLSQGPSGSFLQQIAVRWVFALFADVLPQNVRRQYPTLPYGWREWLTARASFLVLRGVWKVLPYELRDWPRCQAAMRRVGAAGPPGLLGRWLDNKLPPPYNAASDSAHRHYADAG